MSFDNTVSKRVIIVRHEPTLANRMGVIQGQSVNSALEKSAIDEAKLEWFRSSIVSPAIIVSSSAPRAEESAQLIASLLSLSVVKTPLLRQRCWGEIEGKTIRELGNAFVKNAFLADADKLPSGAEPLAEVMTRVRKVWEFIRGFSQSTILLVTHDEFSNYLINEILGEGLFKRPLSYNEAHIIELSNSSTSSVRLHQTIATIPFSECVLVREDAPTFRMSEDGLGPRILNNRGIRTVYSSENVELEQVRGIIIGDKPFTPEDLLRFSNLKVVSRFGKGVNNVLVKPDGNLWIANTPDCNEQAVAEFTVGTILNLSRGISNSARLLSERNLWMSTLQPHWSQVTIGVVGLGTAGRLVVETLSKLGFQLLVWTAHPDKHHDFIDEAKLRLAMSIDELFTSVDVVTLHISANSETRNLVNLERLSLLKRRQGYLINTSRAEVMDYKALKTALKKGWISGAAIDVWPEEPIRSLWLRQLACNPNVIATPHTAGKTKSSVVKAVSLCAYNVAWVLVGRPESACCVSAEDLGFH